MEAYLLDWANLLLRWLHLVAGVAWIGASFYFVMLDSSLRPPAREADAARGVHGELWAVHGGGFYRSQKYLTGPRDEPLSTHLHWSKWEAYTTWLSGIGLLAIVYWLGAATHLIDRSVADLAPAAAVGLSLGFLAGGWAAYELLCRALGGRGLVLALALLLLVAAASWALHQLFAARAASLHLGAMLGTMMAANVFVHIIPGQKRMVAQIRAGEAVDPGPGRIGKQRSVHNTYFTLPVLFAMVGGHFPMTYAHPQGWLVLLAIMAAGVLIRRFFVLRHAGRRAWWLPAAGAALLAATAALLAPAPADPRGEQVTLNQVQQVFAARCTACHAEHPSWEGFAQPPKGIMLETPAQILQHAAKSAETVASGYMPLGNLTGITTEERALVARWFAQQDAAR